MIRHVISVRQFEDKQLLTRLFKRASEFIELPPAQYPKPLTNLTMASVFFEPSTRTRLSFETALQNLGAQLISVENASEFSSAKKGESLEDTIKVLNAYADGIIMRHPEPGAAERAAKISAVPLINAGDGGGEHPTQALLDLYSIERFLGKVDGLKIALVGDLKHSRSHHSLALLLSNFNVELYLVAPKVLAMPTEVLDYLRGRKVVFQELTTWEPVIDKLDVLYMNRIQQERFRLEEEYLAVKDAFCLTMKDVKRMKKSAAILDPLPRINEIAVEVDSDHRAKYFEQVKNGLYLRMALLEYLYQA